MDGGDGQDRERLLVATHNVGKLAELRDLLRGVPYTLVSLTDVGIELDVDETGQTLEENAALKATTYARLAGLLTLADDSGLEVDALAGAPGVHSARYAGPDASDADRIARLLHNIAPHPQPWSARFRCVIAIATPEGDTELHGGTCEGAIISHPRGDNGFGYDPIFHMPAQNRTMAELSDAEKNTVSHRAIAARKAADALNNLN